MADCKLCNRVLGNLHGLRQHLEAVHPWDWEEHWCGRCKRCFVSPEARQQHLLKSSAHHFCDYCTADYPYQDELDLHLEDDHNVCTDCDIRFWSESALRIHNVEEHNMCDECDQYFTTPSNLKYHQQTHAQKTHCCPKCPRMFVTESAMVLHLEADTCEGGVDLFSVKATAYACYQSKKYLRKHDPDYEFQCPTCETPYRFMSALLQHAESAACSETLEHHRPLGKFLHYLFVRRL
ncbi:hypothetical protein B0I35DRAFT_452787 [Stachybotrys elegans]|uniref:C2H2-type domain-containing protein n=1 Tax=Stachybotrys elegans TaxID=80388 RepID=A0A8K0SLN5_9HYPO|nr:hypothetical protein B0I35DRAFT_452787 [Stachybotrys elegans]